MKIQGPIRPAAPRSLAPATPQSLPSPAEPLAPNPPEPPVNNREVRIARFVRNLRRESLEHLRYLSTIWAFNMVGTTVGLMAFTPIGIHFAHENPAVVGGTAIGGGVVTGGAAALLGYALEKRAEVPERSVPKSNRWSEGALTVASGLRALPKFLYPSVVGATPAQEKVIYDALDRLPLKDVTASSVMQVIPNLTDTGISGMSQPGLTHTRILLDQGYLNDPIQGPRLVHHEQGHAVDYAGGYGLLGPLNWRGPFGKGPFVSDYARGNRYEDWAESYENYHDDPAHFHANFGPKSEVIERAAHQTPVEKLMDNDTVRQAGRATGHALAQVPLLRTGLETGLAVLSPLQLHRGAVALEQGFAQNNDALKLRGKMSLISGVLMGVPGGAPLATIASAMNLGMQVQVGEDPAKLKSANTLADRFMAVATGPLGMASVAISQELLKSGVDLQAMNNLPEEDPDVSGGQVLRGLLCTVGGSIVGSLVGVALGNHLVGAAGASLSAFWGRLGGGMLGLGAYGAYQAFKKENAEPSPYDLTRNDKVYLTKIVGGAAVGATLGTAGGVLGGRALGRLVGQTLGGPGAGEWAASLGGWAGALIGSYALGKVGAVAGRHLTQSIPQD